MSEQVGTVIWISGPVVRARGPRHVGMLELVEVGEEHLVGEVIGLNGDIITAQVYEETSGMRPGAPVFGTGLPLSVELGPGLLKSIFDGVQRPLPLIEMQSGSFIGRGMRLTRCTARTAGNSPPSSRKATRSTAARSWAPCWRPKPSSTASWCRRTSPGRSPGWRRQANTRSRNRSRGSRRARTRRN